MARALNLFGTGDDSRVGKRRRITTSLENLGAKNVSFSDFLMLDGKNLNSK